LEYNRANREVAILCNHQRAVPKAFAAAWEKLQAKVRPGVGVGVSNNCWCALHARTRRPPPPAPTTAAAAVSHPQEALLRRQLAELEEHVKLAEKGKSLPLKTDPPEPAAAAGAGMDEEAAAAAADEAVKKHAAEEAHLFARQPDVEDVEKRVVVSGGGVDHCTTAATATT